MASNSKDDVVIVKVENGRILKRTNSTSETGSPSQSRKKRKLVTSPSSDEVLTIDCDTRKTNSTDSNSYNGKGKDEGKENKVRVGDNENQSLAVSNITEELRALEENGNISPEDIVLMEQQMLDHALALSLEQEELEKLSRSHISNEREYPTSNITSLPSRVSPQCSNNLTSSSQPLISDSEATSSQAFTAAESLTDKEFELPMYWQPMPENCPKNYELFMVLPGTEEYNTITQQFLHQPLSVYSVKRIQNLEFLKRYTLEKKLILSVRGKDFNLNEQRLFHTSAANPDDICEQGLDNRLSRSGGSFGAGIYFSDDVLKCHCYWRQSFQPALMFQCRVILGDIKEYPRGVRDVGLRREPEKVVRNPGEQRTYDSVKGNITGRNEFVVYNTYRVMPEYMIEYTFTNTSYQTALRQPTAPHYHYGPPPPILAAALTNPRFPKKKGRGRGRKGS